MASFQAKIGRKMPRKRKNKNYRSGLFRSYTTRNRKFQINIKKIQKIKKKPLWLHFKPKQVVKCHKREKIKIPLWHYGILSSQNRLENDEKERK